jgi:hypothetical protein
LPIDRKPVLGQSDQVSAPEYGARGGEPELLGRDGAAWAGWPDPLLGLEPAPPQQVVVMQRNRIVEKSARFLAPANHPQHLGGGQAEQRLFGRLR